MMVIFWSYWLFGFKYSFTYLLYKLQVVNKSNRLAQQTSLIFGLGQHKIRGQIVLIQVASLLKKEAPYQAYNIKLEVEYKILKMEINAEKCKNLIIGIVAIYSFYFVGSVIQQRIMKVPYQNRQTGQMENFDSSNAFILFPSVVSWGIGYVYHKCCKSNSNQLTIPQKSWLKSAALILLGALSMTKAIYLTNYPLVTLFKSCNLLSVLTIGIFCSKVKDTTQKLQKNQLLIGFIVTVGVILYHYNSVQTQNKEQRQASYLGIGLLIFSLVCDGLIPDYQAEIKTKYKPTPLEMFEHMNRWKTYLALAYSVLTLQIKDLVVFLIQHPMCFVHLMCLSLAGAVGQIFVYWLINSFRQHVVPFIITTRKILTVVISILYFGHHVTAVQISGIVIVFLAVFYQFTRQITKSSQQKPSNPSTPIPQSQPYQKIQKQQPTEQIQSLYQPSDYIIQQKCPSLPSTASRPTHS